MGIESEIENAKIYDFLKRNYIQLTQPMNYAVTNAVYVLKLQGC